jgi:MFS family permease
MERKMPDKRPTTYADAYPDPPENFRSTALLRWFISSAALAVPQASSPVAFSLVALSVIGDARGGAAMILAMTIAQVFGAVPITRLRKKSQEATFLKLLVIFRTLALLAIALCAYFEVSFVWLVASSAVAGVVSGAAYGYLRSLLNYLTPASKLPRAQGIAATLNEVTFVLGPVVASGLGTISPVFAIVVLAILGGSPALLIPHVEAQLAESAVQGGGPVLTPAILLWLVCAGAVGATVAAIEIGAVALALKFSYQPALAVLFTVPLCVASVSGGIWISIRNRLSSRREVFSQLFIMAFGLWLVVLSGSVILTVAGAILVGLVVAPLGTYFALILDMLAPPDRRPEVFALLRTSYSLGIIFTSGTLTAVSLEVALLVVAGSMSAVTLCVGFLDPTRRYN